MSSVISIENVSKSYRLGVIGSGTLREDLQSWWHRKRGLPDPNLRVDQAHLAVEGHTLWALNDVSLEVKQGEVLGIIGRNGAGKSTLLKILSRVTAPTSGRIRVKGRVASLLEVGTGFHPELTGRENTFLNGAILGMTKAEVARKFDEIVAFSEIEQFIDTPVKRYSSGMYVRLAFAVAAHLDPEILVVDEVLAVGDAAFQKKCLGKMGAVAQEGRTVLFVSHNLSSIIQLCDTCVLLSAGRVVSIGTAEETVEQYLAPNSDAEYDINQDAMKDRKGSGDIRIKRIVLLNEQLRPVHSVPSGAPCVLRFEVVSSHAVQDIHCSFGLFNSRGARIAQCSTLYCGGLIRLTPDQKTIDCYFERLRLVPDDYSLNILIEDMHNRPLDHVQSAFILRVIGGDYYRSGKMPTLALGNALLDYTYKLS
jgi:lipopolysaccharide transport system ATP-binding protein